MGIKSRIKAVLGISSPPPKSIRLPASELATLFPANKVDVKILEPVSTNGNVTVQELFSLNFAAATCAPKTIFEIGTFDGRTTLNLAANSPSDTRVYTLDLPASGLQKTKFMLEEYDKSYVDKEQSGSRFLSQPESSKITQLYGDSATFNFEPYFNSIDLVFVDGSHAYEYVLNDSKIALKLLRNGKGIILWHDYGNDCWPGVVRGLEELQATTPQFKNIKHVANTTIAYLRQ